MALRIAHDTPYGVGCPDAHCVIIDVRCDYQTNEEGVKTAVVQYSGKIWYDVSAYNDNKSAIGGFNFDYPLIMSDGADYYNIIKECYENLKTQQSFEMGIDC